MKDELKELRRQLAIGQAKEAKELQELHRMHEEDVPALIQKETNTFKRKFAENNDFAKQEKQKNRKVLIDVIMQQIGAVI